MKPKIICLYRCPECEGYMECSIQSISYKKGEFWKCVQCKKEFVLSFRRRK